MTTLEVAQAMVRDLQERLADADRRITVLGKVIELKNHALDRLQPCPDCSDKVRAGECERCRWQAAEARAERLTAQRDDLRQRITLLRAFAQGWIKHEGACLDSETGSGSRDLGCPVCRLLLEDDPPEIVATARRSRA